MIASHPVYQYFSRRYGINLRSGMWEPDVVPGEDEWLELEQLLREHPANWFIWESRPAPASLERLQQLGIQSTVFDPSANVPESGTFADVMTENIKALDRIFRSTDPQSKHTGKTPADNVRVCLHCGSITDWYFRTMVFFSKVRQDLDSNRNIHRDEECLIWHEHSSQLALI